VALYLSVSPAHITTEHQSEQAGFKIIAYLNVENIIHNLMV